jgi:acyl-CoA reductase-like NAD-dependent aldehyde dehydrogenase
MAVWKLILVANRARRGWKRIPPEQRRRIMETAGQGVRTHGPVVARRIGTVVKNARKAR